jgi:hypothetical protein
MRIPGLVLRLWAKRWVRGIFTLGTITVIFGAIYQVFGDQIARWGGYYVGGPEIRQVYEELDALHQEAAELHCQSLAVSKKRKDAISQGAVDRVAGLTLETIGRAKKTTADVHGKDAALLYVRLHDFEHWAKNLKRTNVARFPNAVARDSGKIAQINVFSTPCES